MLDSNAPAYPTHPQPGNFDPPVWHGGMSIRDHVAIEIMARVVGTAIGVGNLTAAEKRELFTQASEICFEVTDIFLETRNDNRLPADVIALVIAAREAVFMGGPESIKALDKACEAFASRVAWEDDPNDVG